MSTSNIKSKTPLPVTIISWLMLFAGLSNSLGFLIGVGLLAFQSNLEARAGIEEIGTLSNIYNISIFSIPNIIRIILGIGLIIVAYGLGRMHRWALYVFTVLTIIGAISLAYFYMIYPNQNLSGFLPATFQAMILIYLWSISKKFV